MKIQFLPVLAAVACLALFLAPGAQAQQLAEFEFDNQSLSSTAADPHSTASDLSVNNAHVFANWGSNGWFICLTPAWANNQEQGPFNNSTNYVETTITPDAAKAQLSLRRTWSQDDLVGLLGEDRLGGLALERPTEATIILELAVDHAPVALQPFALDLSGMSLSAALATTSFDCCMACRMRSRSTFCK